MRRFKEARIRKRLKLTVVAQTLGVTQPTISSWESERKSPSLDMVVKMAELYGVTTDYLLGRNTEFTPGRTSPIPSEILPTLDGKPVWIPEHGWALVNGTSNSLLFADGKHISFEEVKSQQLGPELFADFPAPSSIPISFAKLPSYSTIWIEPISKDSEIRQALRGRYQVKHGYAENNCGNRFSFSSYEATWLAFEITE